MLHNVFDPGSARAAPPEIVPLAPESLVEFAMATVDRREWRVRIALSTLAALSGHSLRSGQIVDSILNHHMHRIQLAALRVIGRGGAEGDIVRIRAADLRLLREG